MNKTKTIFALHLVLAVYSLLGIASKLAGQQPFLSPRFCLYYGIVLVNLALYAVVWQQILKRLPLVTAYANKAATVIWGIVWGAVFFKERITPGKIVGAAVIIVGVYLVVAGDSKEKS